MELIDLSKIDTLLQALEMEDDIIREYCEIENIEVDTLSSTWIFYFVFERTIPILHYRNFISNLAKLTSVYPSLKAVDYQIKFNNISDDDIIDYYDFVLDVLTEENKRIMPLKDYETDFSDNSIKIYVPKGAISALIYRKDIEAEMLRNGIKIDVEIIVDENKGAIEEEIIKANNDFVAQNKQDEVEEKIDFVSLTNGSAITDLVPIKDIPYSEVELEDYREKHGGKAIVSIEGKVVMIEFVENSRNSLCRMVVTDGFDSIYLIKKNLSASDINLYKTIEEGFVVKAKCFAMYDTYLKEVILHPIAISRSKEIVDTDERIDTAKEKRVELHLHTKMSALDGVNTISEYYNRAKKWNHKAIGVSDHGSVQSFPELYHLAKNNDVKPLYGLELTYVDDENFAITKGESNLVFSDTTFVIFDIETTGLSVNYDTLIEIAGVKVKNSSIIGEFSELINPQKEIIPFTEKLTGISNSMVKGKRLLKDVLNDFYEFSKNTILVAHNADFDLGFLDYNYKKYKITNTINESIDTLNLAKVLLPKRSRFSLDNLCRYFKVPLDGHHRAINDAKATTEVFLHLLKMVRKEGINRFRDINLLIEKKNIFKYPYPKHINMLVKQQDGLKNLYKILSEALTTYYDREGKIVKSYLDKHRKGILISSGCFNSHFFEIARNKSKEELIEAAKYYDYIEVQPPSQFCFLSEEIPNYRDVMQDVIKRIIEVADELNILVVATGDTHHLDPSGIKYREILINTPLVGNGGFHDLQGRKEIPNQYYMTTDEMLEEFKFLGMEKAYEIVVRNSNIIADSIEDIQIIPDELFAPTDEFLANMGVPSIKIKVEKMVNERVREIYGDPLPNIVKHRVDRELDNIIKHKFSTVYYISHLLVKKSLDDGYLVGSRGSVGSSFVATLMGITEVNPLPPHYVCPKCHFTAFKKTDEQKVQFGETDFEKSYAQVFEETDCGWDLPKLNCPICNTELVSDGHDIPFETFLGFKGDKVPDIDLNFSGDYQGEVHEYIRKLFGKDYAFRGGTIGTCAAKTSFAMVRDYYDKINEKRKRAGQDPVIIRHAEIERLSKGIEGSKRTSGQHPGGIVVVPNTKEIYDFTPVQYPGESKDRSWRTTHYEYHAIENNLFKLDVLGHDDPTMIRYLMDLVEKEPLNFPFSNPKDIPVNDPEVYKLLSGTDIINLKKEDIDSDVASYGIPEFGTSFVRGMLAESKPKTFAELVKISGLSHGTDVWYGNSQSLVSGNNREFGKVDFKNIIGCRDDIMVDLISYNMQPTKAFEIMEFVRKGKPSKAPEKWAEYVKEMRASHVPDWYIWSCTKIKYMFPKAHATAYVLMAMRIAWFKLYKPIYFYAAYFSKRASQFDARALYDNYEGINRKLTELKALGKEATDRDQNLQTVLEVALEMVQRGFSFKPIDLYKSDARNFLIDEDKKSLILPFIVIDSMGLTAAESIVAAREEKEFISKQDVKNRTRLSTTLFDKLELLGTFDGMIEKNQMSLFDL